MTFIYKCLFCNSLDTLGAFSEGLFSSFWKYKHYIKLSIVINLLLQRALTEQQYFIFLYKDILSFSY